VGSSADSSSRATIRDEEMASKQTPRACSWACCTMQRAIDSLRATRRRTANKNFVTVIGNPLGSFWTFHLATIDCSFAQPHTAFLFSSVSFASGCIAVYAHGGILAVDMSPQMESNLSIFCRAE